MDGGGDAGNLLHLARANQRCRIGMRAALQDFGRRHGPGACRKLAEFGQGFFGVQFG